MYQRYLSQGEHAQVVQFDPYLISNYCKFKNYLKVNDLFVKDPQVFKTQH